MYWVKMRGEELKRNEILNLIEKGRLKRHEAAEQLGLTIRQIDGPFNCEVQRKYKKIVVV